MSKAAFIDHSFKKKSKSSEFFIDILREKYEVDIYWDDSWKELPGVDLELIGKRNYDVVVFFQVFNIDPKQLKEHNIKNAVFVPMYDASHWLHKDFLMKFSRYKFINFSKKLHKNFKKLNLNSIYTQYYCPPPKEPDFDQRQELTGFFWQRYDWINWNHISSLIKHAPFKKIHIHKAIDPPGYEFYPPTQEEMDKYDITISEWFEDPQEYFEILDKSDVFFVPRKYEGIGMSFIEAMAMGKCVVAPDLPTMNEYIIHEENGLLYDLQKLKPLSFENINEISRNAFVTVKSGYEQWKEGEQRILEFCDAPTRYWNGRKETSSGNVLVNSVKNGVYDLRHHINYRYPKAAKFMYNVRKRIGLNL